jgi:hypothetical protein
MTSGSKVSRLQNANGWQAEIHGSFLLFHRVIWLCVKYYTKTINLFVRDICHFVMHPREIRSHERLLLFICLLIWLYNSTKNLIRQEKPFRLNTRSVLAKYAHQKRLRPLTSISNSNSSSNQKLHNTISTNPAHAGGTQSVITQLPYALHRRYDYQHRPHTPSDECSPLKTTTRKHLLDCIQTPTEVDTP